MYEALDSDALNYIHKLRNDDRFPEFCEKSEQEIYGLLIANENRTNYENEFPIMPEIHYEQYTPQQGTFNIELFKENHTQIEKYKQGSNVNREEANEKKTTLKDQGMELFMDKRKAGYLFSKIDSSDKYSCGYNNCTAVTLFGKEKKTGRTISFLSHQDPDFFLKNQDTFKDSLSNKLQLFKNKCIEGSIVSLIGGGNIGSNQKDSTYDQSLILLKPLISSVFGKEATILNPNNSQGTVTIHINNNEQKINILQPLQDT